MSDENNSVTFAKGVTVSLENEGVTVEADSVSGMDGTEEVGSRGRGRMWSHGKRGELFLVEEEGTLIAGALLAETSPRWRAGERRESDLQRFALRRR